MWADLKQACRSLLRSPGLCVTATCVLGTSLALAATVYAIADALLLRPLPIARPDALRFLYTVDRTGQYAGVSYQTYLDLRSRIDAFEALGVSSADRARVSGGGLPDETIRGEAVSANYFSVLGITPVLGTTFESQDEAVEGPAHVIISEDLFRARFQGDPSAIGRVISLRPRGRGTSAEAGQAYTIVGVIGREFGGLSNPWERTQYWVSLRTRARDYACDDPRYLSDGHRLVFGRIRPDVSTTAAAGQITSIVASTTPTTASSRRASSLVLLHARRVQLPFDPSASMLPETLAVAFFGICAVLLAIAATNLTGMLLARSATRRSEYAVRLMLGASPGRVVRLVFIESVLLSVAACVLGLWMAVLLTRAFAASLPSQFGTIVSQTVWLDVGVNAGTVLVVIVVALAVAVSIALPPAIQAVRTSRLDFESTAHLVGGRRMRRRLQWAVVLPQITLSVMLLILAGGLLRTLAASETGDPGYRSHGLAFVEFEALRPGRCLSAKPGVITTYGAERRRLAAVIEQDVRALPVVAGAASALFLPAESRGRAFVERRPRPQARTQTGGGRSVLQVARVDVGPGYFAVMQIPLLQGREFEERDRPESAAVAIVSRSLADTLWPDGDALGQMIGLGDGNVDRAPRWVELVGIAGDVRPALSETAPASAVYLPTTQGLGARTVVVRHRGRLVDTLDALRTSVQQVSPDIEVLRAGSVQSLVASIRYPRRVSTAALTLTGCCGIILTSIGLYGLLSYSVRQRTSEMGVRMALGANSRAIAALVLKDGLWLGVAGTCAGALLAYVAARVASRFLPFSPPDVITTLSIAALVMLIVGVASYLPARRAWRIDPTAVLRQQ